MPPGIVLDDPRPIAAGAPYTFEMPFDVELAALRTGDGVQAIFRQTEGGTKYSAERLWVLIERIENDIVFGLLDNDPADMTLIEAGMPVAVPLTHVISTAFSESNPRPETPNRPNFWNRCMVDACVVEGRSHVDYLYREEPDMTREGDTYPDSGWRIRGTHEAIDDDAERGAKPSYIALGKVLNVQDHWLDLIDAPFGTRYGWWAEEERFVEVD